MDETGLTRLLLAGNLAALCVDNAPHFAHMSPSPAFCAAVEGCRLVRLQLSGVYFWDDVESG